VHLRCAEETTPSRPCGLSDTRTLDVESRRRRYGALGPSRILTGKSHRSKRIPDTPMSTSNDPSTVKPLMASA
jgi:hypothetical protein